MKQTLKKYRLLYVVVISLSIASALLMTLFSIQLGRILDSLSASQEQLWFQIGLCLLSVLAWFLISWCYSYTKSNYVKFILLDLKEKLLNYYLSRELSNSQQSGTNFLNILTKDLDLIQENILVPRVAIVANLASMLMGVMAILLIEWRLGLSFLAFSCFTIFLSQIPGRLISKATEEYSQKSKSYLADITHGIDGFEQITLLNIQKWMQQTLQNSTLSFEEARKKYYYRKDLASNTGTFLSFFSQITCMVIGLFFVKHHLLTLGLLIASIQLLNSVFGPLQSFLYHKNLITSADTILKGIQELLDQATNISPLKTETPSTQKGISSISLKHLNYKIANQNIFEDFSFEFKKGKRYAIIGSSGVGKSTLIKLILNYYPEKAYGGAIKIDERYNYEICSEHLYKEIAFIQKSNFIVEGTVLDNIQLGRTGALSEKLKNSLGFNNMFLEKKLLRNSSHLSDGEKQRIDLARFLSHRYSVYIFDEPTSHLDPHLAKKVMDYILSITNAIIIVITHHQDSTILKQFDEIIHLPGKGGDKYDDRKF